MPNSSEHAEREIACMPGLPAFLQLGEVGHGRAERRHPTYGGYEVHSWAPHSLHSYRFLDSMLAPTFVSTRVSHIRWPQGSQVGASHIDNLVGRDDFVVVQEC